MNALVIMKYGYSISLLLIVCAFVLFPAGSLQRMRMVQGGDSSSRYGTGQLFFLRLSALRERKGMRVLIWVCAGFLLVALALIGPQSGPLVSAAVVCVAFALWIVRAHRRIRARRADDNELYALLGLVSAHLRAGLHPSEAFITAHRVRSEQGNDAFTRTRIAKSFESCARSMSLHGGSARALLSSSHDDIHYLGQLWALTNNYGISLAQLVDYVRDNIGSRIKHEKKNSASAQGAYATAIILAILPFGGLLLGQGMGAHGITFLLTTTLGGLLLDAGLIFIALGWVWSYKIIERARRL